MEPVSSNVLAVSNSIPITETYKNSLFTDSIINDKFPIQFKYSKKRKTHAVAQRKIEQGEDIFVEKASCYTIKHSFLTKFCQNCGFLVAPSKSKTGENKIRMEKQDSLDVDSFEKENNLPLNEFSCVECKITSYCSDRCRLEDLKIHEIECEIVQKINSPSFPSGFNHTRARFIIRYLINAKLQDKEENLEVSHEKQTPIRYIDFMKTNLEAYDGYWMKQALSELGHINSIIPKDITFDFIKLKEIYCIYQASSIDFFSSNDSEGTIFSGLFPLTSIFFKHSCYPNAVFYGNNKGQLVFRSLTEIQEGELITISYISLYQSRELRRRELLLKKNIWCNCKRCKEPFETSCDSLLDGALCKECHKGIMIKFETLAPTKKSSYSSFTNSDTDEEGDYDDEPHFIYKCNLCKKIEDSVPINDIFKASNNLYENSMIHLKEKSFKNAINGFEEIIFKYKSSSILSPFSHTIINSMINLVYCYQKTNQPILALSNIRTVVFNLDESKIFPRNWPDLSKLRITLGKLLVQVANERHEKLPNSSKEIVKKYYKLAIESFKLALNELSVSFGPSHIYTNQVRALLEICKSSNPAYLYNSTYKPENDKFVKPIAKMATVTRPKSVKGFNLKPKGLVNQPPPTTNS
ncbi:Histone-lysine N-methyltransferase ASHR1 [Smittium culicis]|uniref:Histone-lysine N-methyltransferase ASHR1 n=1 Tax=Smittium culicis TaxID=133412 RepID=A0A1R1YA44_9FUNG|nr:Histone-lysine N-methyltransferase ASHR1 [Smittium culicis]